MAGRVRVLLLAPLLALSLLLSGRVGAATVVDFEGLPDGTWLGAQIATVEFTNAVVLTAGVGLNELEFPPLSGSNVAVDDAGPMTLSFSTPVQTLVLFATYGVPLQMAAFDHNGGTLLAQAGSLFSSNVVGSGDAGSSPNERFELTVPGGFTFVRITGAPDGSSFVIDDLTLTPVPEPSSAVLLLLGCSLVFLLRRRLSAASAGALLLSATASGIASAQTAPTPLLSPAAVHIGAPTAVLVSARLGLPHVLPGGVNVLRSAAGGAATVVGTLNDSGTDGDALAGDGVWAGRAMLTESIEGGVSLRLSVAVRGSIRRLQSTPALLSVVPAAAPLAPTLPDLSQRSTDPASGADIVAGRLNACFGDTVSFAAVNAAAAAVGGTPVGRLSPAGNCYQLAVSPGDGASIAAAAAILAGRPEVRFAEPEAITRGAACAGPICADPNFSTVLRLPQAQLRSTGAGAVIGIIDSGLDAARIPGVNFSSVNLGSNFSSTGTAGIPRDDHGHGTLVAYIALSSAPDATLFVSKVLNANLEGTDTASMMGIAEAVRNGAQILNMSLSSRLQSFTMRELITRLQNAGLLIVAAAGNDGSSVREYPAAHVGVIAVGNVDDRDAIHTGVGPSNFGPWVNIAAPGVNVAGFGGAGTGTSFSAPFVAAAAALVASKFPSMDRVAIIEQLRRTALPIPAQAGMDTCPAQPCNQNLGWGRLDVEAALGAIRISRTTAVNAPAAGIARQIEVEVQGAGGASLFSETRGFFGQSTGCEVATVRNPPCISSVPFDLAARPPGRYVLRLSFRDPSASFFGNVRLFAPGARFTAVISGGGAINAGDPTQADFSLFGFGVRTVFLEITKS